MLRGHYTSALVRFQDDTTVSSANYPYFGTSDGDYRPLSPSMAAVYRLWCAAASEVRIQHPHPRVYIHHHVSPGYNDVRIRMACVGLPDNDNHDKIAGDKTRDGAYPSSFGMTSYVRQWPGYTVARMYLLSQYAILQLHEAMENCWYMKQDTAEDRVIHPHYDSLRYHHLAILGDIDDGKFQAALAYVVGESEARRVIRENEAQAARELENEIAAGSFD